MIVEWLNKNNGKNQLLNKTRDLLTSEYAMDWGELALTLHAPKLFIRQGKIAPKRVFTKRRKQELRDLISGTDSQVEEILNFFVDHDDS